MRRSAVPRTELAGSGGARVAAVAEGRADAELAAAARGTAALTPRGAAAARAAAAAAAAAAGGGRAAAGAGAGALAEAPPLKKLRALLATDALARAPPVHAWSSAKRCAMQVSARQLEQRVRLEGASLSLHPGAQQRARGARAAGLHAPLAQCASNCTCTSSLATKWMVRAHKGQVAAWRSRAPAAGQLCAEPERWLRQKTPAQSEHLNGRKSCWWHRWTLQWSPRSANSIDVSL